MAKILNYFIITSLHITLGAFVGLMVIWCFAGEVHRAGELSLPAFLNLGTIFLWRFLYAMEVVAQDMKDEG